MPLFQNVEKCTIHVDTSSIANHEFAGVGFHVAYHMNEEKSNKEHFEQVIAKRWRELAPSFARVWHTWRWNQEELDRFASHLLRMKNDTNTIIYVTTLGPKVVRDDKEMKAYAKLIADQLEYLIKEKGCTNVKYYCMTNELSLNAWGDMRYCLDVFKNYHQAFFDEFTKRKLPVGLLATDASPKEWWGTILWAEKNMDDITAVYGGHTYFNDMLPDFKYFYRYWTEYTDWAGELSKRTGKHFILGEFGCSQDNRVVDGVLLDRCKCYYDERLAPLVALQLAEAVIAAINSGFYAMATWTFSDYPDPPWTFSDYPDPPKGANRINKWGTFKWTDDGDYSTRDHYYGYGLLTKFLNGPAKTFRTSSNDGLVHAAALQHHNGTWSFAICNRNDCRVPIELVLDSKINLRLRKYVYDSSKVPQNQFGDLQTYSEIVDLKEGVLNDVITPESLYVYTTQYSEMIPAKVEGITSKECKDGTVVVKWDHSKEKDFCYYRVFRGEKPDFKPDNNNQIVSTIGNEYIDKNVEKGKKYFYKVCVVDKWGNVGEV